MPTLIDRHGPIADGWTWFQPAGEAETGAEASGQGNTGPVAGAARAVAPARRVILTLAQWPAHADALTATGARLGICLEPADEPAAVVPLFERIELIAVRFPAFTDGRGYSAARLLRQRHGWKGELRAVGDVLRDQMFYLARCGFDTFGLKDGESVAQALKGFGDFSEAYQAAVDRGPLFRRRVPAHPLASVGAPMPASAPGADPAGRPRHRDSQANW
jgi:uncharacterized protein (DUF934 family)